MATCKLVTPQSRLLALLCICECRQDEAHVRDGIPPFLYSNIAVTRSQLWLFC